MGSEGEEGGGDGARATRRYPTPAHEELGLTRQELLEEMASRGEDPNKEAAYFDEIQRALRERQRERGAQGPAATYVAGALPRSALGRALLLGEGEAPTSGPAAPGAGPALRPAELSDLFGDQNWAGIAIARMAGSAMSGARIDDGDAVLVDTRRKPRDGDIVLAHLSGRGQLVRRYRRDPSGRERLEAANPASPPIEIDGSAALTLHGVVVGRAGKI